MHVFIYVVIVDVVVIYDNEHDFGVQYPSLIGILVGVPFHYILHTY